MVYSSSELQFPNVSAILKEEDNSVIKLCIVVVISRTDNQLMWQHYTAFPAVGSRSVIAIYLKAYPLTTSLLVINPGILKS